MTARRPVFFSPCKFLRSDGRQPAAGEGPCAGGVGGKGGRWHTMAWMGRLSTFSTKNNMFTHVCDVTLSSDAPATRAAGQEMMSKATAGGLSTTKLYDGSVDNSFPGYFDQNTS